MTVDKDLKKLVRARAARTGESYAAAKRSLQAKNRAAAAPVPVEGWFARSSQGYGGKKASKPVGYEHHVITGRHVESTIVFRSYGIHRIRVTADGDGRTSTFRYGDEVVVEAALRGSTWAAGEFSLDIPATGDIDVVPSVVGRFLPLHVPRETGELARYLPVPEDGFPAWAPPATKNWFPLMGAGRESRIVARTIVGRGDSPDGYRYEHIGAGGTVWATTWIDDEGRVSRYEQVGLVLVAVTPREVEKLTPR